MVLQIKYLTTLEILEQRSLEIIVIYKYFLGAVVAGFYLTWMIFIIKPYLQSFLKFLKSLIGIESISVYNYKSLKQR